MEDENVLLLLHFTASTRFVLGPGRHAFVSLLDSQVEQDIREEKEGNLWCLLGRWENMGLVNLSNKDDKRPEQPSVIGFLPDKADFSRHPIRAPSLSLESMPTFF